MANPTPDTPSPERWTKARILVCELCGPVPARGVEGDEDICGQKVGWAGVVPATLADQLEKERDEWRQQAENGGLRAWPDSGTVRDRLLAYLESPERESEADGLFGVSSLGWWGNEATRETLRSMFSRALSLDAAEAQRDQLAEAVEELLSFIALQPDLPPDTRAVRSLLSSPDTREGGDG